MRTRAEAFRRGALIAAASVAIAAPAVAQTYKVTPPASWAENPDLGKGQARTLVGTDPFGGVKFEVKVTAHAQPGEGALYVTWIAALEPSKEPGAVIRRALDDIRATRLAGNALTASTTETSYREAVAGGVLDAQLVWRHLSNDTDNHVRTLVWATPDKLLRLLRGECVLASDASGPVVQGCLATLASLAPDSPVGELGPVPAAVAPDEAAARQRDLAVGSLDPAAEPEPGPEPPTEQGPELRTPRSGDKVLYQQQPPPAKESSSSLNKILVVAGGILLVAAFWYMARRRAKPEPEPESEPEPEPEPDSDKENP